MHGISGLISVPDGLITVLILVREVPIVYFFVVGYSVLLICL